MNHTPLWMPQEKAIRLVTETLAFGERRACCVLPTGGGKTRVACELIRDWLVCGHQVSLYTNRKMLINQLARELSAFGLTHGLRTADAIERGRLPNDFPLQISSIQTEASRTLKRKTWTLHPATRVLIDEAHLNHSDTARQLMEKHLEMGGSYVGLTATPIDLGHFYDHLVIGGTNSELRECGAIVMARHFGCEEPDTSKVRKATVELTENDIRKIMKVQHIVGFVKDRLLELNPNLRPTILFAPDVAGSIWLCEHLNEAGIPSAHIDGTTCVYRGERHDSSQELRDEIMRASKSGEVKVVCNRFVLREGIDTKWIEHMILATIFGSLQSYLQSTGRGLRASPGKEMLTIQDHGGNWWRHGSVNINRAWSLDDTERSIAGTREERIRKGEEPEPMRCPQCGKVCVTNKCSCGYTIGHRSRQVIQENGRIVEHKGDIFKPRRIKEEPNTAKIWERTYHRAKNSRNQRTFSQAFALFNKENHYYPPPDLPLMPKNDRDRFRRVKDVPREALR